MVVAFANNQMLSTVQGTTITVHTDPVPLGNSDRLSAMLNVHAVPKANGVATVTLTYTAQLSNDGGQNYVDSGTVTGSATMAGVTQVVGTVNAALVRFKYTLAITGGAAGEYGGVCFDLHVNFDHV